jgi:predicted aspartyl protease
MATGYLDANGDPHIVIQLSGAFGPQHAIDCLIDSGFTGFLSLPLTQAFPVGLILQSTTNVVFANGQTEVRLVCLGLVDLDGVREAGLILVESQGTQAAIGMDFLRKFNRRLIIDPSGHVEFVPAVVPVPIPTESAPLFLQEEAPPTAGTAPASIGTAPTV